MTNLTFTNTRPLFLKKGDAVKRGTLVALTCGQ